MTADLAQPATTDDPELARILDRLGFGEADQARRAAQTEAAQRKRWNGAEGLDILSVPTTFLPPDGGEQGCEACGGPLGEGRRGRRFCSTACRVRAHRARVRADGAGAGRRKREPGGGSRPRRNVTRHGAPRPARVS